MCPLDYERVIRTVLYLKRIIISILFVILKKTCCFRQPRLYKRLTKQAQAHNLKFRDVWGFFSVED